VRQILVTMRANVRRDRPTRRAHRCHAATHKRPDQHRCCQAHRRMRSYRQQKTMLTIKPTTSQIATSKRSLFVVFRFFSPLDSVVWCRKKKKKKKKGFFFFVCVGLKFFLFTLIALLAAMDNQQYRQRNTACICLRSDESDQRRARCCLRRRRRCARTAAHRGHE
jgi:hypothetical protein